MPARTPGLFRLSSRSQRPSCPSEYSIHSPLLLHAFMFSRPNSSRGLRRDVGLAVGGSRAQPSPARASGRTLCELRTPLGELAGQLRVATHEANDGGPQG